MILFDHEVRDALHKFLQAEISAENLLFYEAVEDIKLSGSSAYQAMHPKADFMALFLDIKNRFLIDNAAEEINISEGLKTELRKTAKEFIIVKNLNKAQREVIGIMAGCLERFLQSALFKNSVASSSSEGLTLPMQIQGPAMKASTKRQTFPFQMSYALGIKSATSKIQRRETILIIEAVEIVALLLEKSFRAYYDVTLAANGKKALEVLTLQGFDAVLVHIDLEDRDGLTAIKSFNRTLKNKRIEEIANGGSLQDRKPMVIMGMAYEKKLKLEMIALKEGFHAVLVKPFSFYEFQTSRATQRSIIRRVSEMVISSSHQSLHSRRSSIASNKYNKVNPQHVGGEPRKLDV